MKVRVLQENFSKALFVAIRFSSARAQLPILSHVLLSAKGNKLLVSATNLEISVCLSLGAKVIKEGTVSVPARTIYDLVSNLNQGQIELTAEKEQLKIVSPDFSSSLMGADPSDYPEVPKKLSGKGYQIEGSLIKEVLDQTLFAVSNDETRPILTGSLFVFEKNGLTVVSTDGFRLSHKTCRFDSKKASEKFVLPRNVLLEITRLAEGEGSLSIEYSQSDNQALFGVEGMVISSRVLQGEYPDYRKIIPKDSTIKVNVDKEDFLKAVKLASVFARDASNIVKLNVKKDALLVSAESQRSGVHEGKVNAKVEGGSLEIAYNYRFLEEYLQSVKGESVEIGLNDAGSPGIFKDPSDKSYFHLIMPVKI